MAKRVLIVDDDETFRLIARESLVKKGYAVDEAADGAQAMEVVRHSVPDLIMVDIMMPGLVGVALCRQFRSIDTTRVTPLLVVTALGDQKILQDALAFGANDYLLKPVDATALRAKVEKLINVPK
jgi:DNA-binding response OmpR family regulator